jgi:hypothetical protein
VHIRLEDKRRPADVEVMADHASVVEHLAVMARDNHQFAMFNEIGLDQCGDLRPEDLQLAWAAGASVALLTLAVRRAGHLRARRPGPRVEVARCYFLVPCNPASTCGS